MTMEVGGVDIVVDSPELHAFIEVKSHSDARRALREAVGQLFEYAHHRPGGGGRNPKLFVVAPGLVSPELKPFVALISRKFGIEYVPVTQETTAWSSSS